MTPLSADLRHGLSLGASETRNAVGAALVAAGGRDDRCTDCVARLHHPDVSVIIVYYRLRGALLCVIGK